MGFDGKVLLVTLALSAASVSGQSSANVPQIGYLYPAGGQAGSVIQITAGGQFLRGPTAVHVSGAGVRAKVIKFQKEQRDLLQKRLKEVRDKRLAELSTTGRRRSTSSQRRAPTKRAAKPEPAQKDSDAKTTEVKLPDHPLLRDLDNKSHCCATSTTRASESWLTLRAFCSSRAASSRPTASLPKWC